MVRVSVFYPGGPGHTFDMAYYCAKHIPLAQKLLGNALKGVSVEEGIAGEAVGTQPPFMAAGHLSFESLDAFAKAFPPIVDQLVADVPNYTNTKPTIQISEVRM
jgi:uncharacterized protein (TIGR02118 family)